jgi:hypothetical protein
LAERREIKKIAKSRPAEHGLPFPTWGLAKLAGFLVTGGAWRQPSSPGVPRLRGGQGRRLGRGHLTCLDLVDDAGYLAGEADVTFWGLCSQCRPEAG